MTQQPTPSSGPLGKIILYQTEDGSTRIEVRLEGEAVWLPQKAMAELFQKDLRTISEHIGNIFDEAELRQEATLRKFRIVQSEGPRQVEREVTTTISTSSSPWATALKPLAARSSASGPRSVREYLIKGFTMDDDRLTRAGGGNYFDELLARIRDIRSSERVFWKKVLDIYATSIDYDATVEASQLFFTTVQNKMHWAAHGQTAAVLGL